MSGGEPKDLSDIVQVACLSEMIKKAKAMGVSKGVGFVFVKHVDFEGGAVKYMVCHQLFTLADNINWFGKAMAVLAAMMASNKDSHLTNSPLQFEAADSGGRAKKVGRRMVFVGFIGGTGEQNLAIADYGLELLLK